MTDLTVPPRPTVHLSFAAFLTPFLELVLICYPGRGYSLGVLLAKQGRFAEAKQHFSEVLRLDPNHAAARPFLAGDVPPGNSTMGASHPDTRPCMSLPSPTFLLMDRFLV